MPGRPQPGGPGNPGSQVRGKGRHPGYKKRGKKRKPILGSEGPGSGIPGSRPGPPPRKVPPPRGPVVVSNDPADGLPGPRRPIADSPPRRPAQPRYPKPPAPSQERVAAASPPSPAPPARSPTVVKPKLPGDTTTKPGVPPLEKGAYVPAYGPQGLSATDPPTKPPKASGGSGQSAPRLSEIKDDMTPQQILQIARQQAEASLAPYRAELLRQQEADRKFAEGRARLVAGLYAQLGALQRSASPAVQGAYTNAATAASQLAGGYASDLMGQQQAAASGANAALNSVGVAPAGQQLGVTDAASRAFRAMEGSIPASNMLSKAAAFGSAAAWMPSMAARSGINESALIMNAYETQRKQYADQLRQLALRAPELINAYTSSLRDYNLRRRGQAVNEWIAQIEQDRADATLGANVAANKATNTRLTQEAILDYKAKIAELDQESRQWLAETFGVAEDGTPTLEALKAMDAEAKWQAQLTKPKTETASQRLARVKDQRQVINDANVEATNLFYGKFGGYDEAGNPIWTQPPVSYMDAVRRMSATFGLTLTLQVLNNYWTRPGFDRDINSMERYWNRKKGNKKWLVWYRNPTEGRPGKVPPLRRQAPRVPAEETGGFGG